MSNTSNPNPQSGAHGRSSAPEQKPISPRMALLVVALLVVVAVVLAVIGILSRKSADTVLAERTQELAAPTVLAAAAKAGRADQTASCCPAT